jgi:hypothetical protein
MEYKFQAELWEYQGQGAWYFVTVPRDISDEIKAITERMAGFGSVRVSVNVGNSVWKTSIFPDSKSGCYVLPVKKDIRKAEGLSAGDEVKVTIARI